MRPRQTVDIGNGSFPAAPPNLRLGPAKPRKSLGQHFLVDERILSRIVAAADLLPDDRVLEVGPGRGALTKKLLPLVTRVMAVEVDAGLAAALPARLGHPANLTVAIADARTADLHSLLQDEENCPAFNNLGRPPSSNRSAFLPPPLRTATPNHTPYKVVANLPYYAANPIIRRFLEADHPPQIMVLMVQREVADNITAVPGKMSLLSVATQFYSLPRQICQVPARAFRPVPKVNSTVVRLDLREQPAVKVANVNAFFDLVRAGFFAPRKQLRNSLSHGLRWPAAAVDDLLHSGQVDGHRRPATLSIEEWASLYAVWEGAGRELAPATIE